MQVYVFAIVFFSSKYIFDVGRLDRDLSITTNNLFLLVFPPNPGTSYGMSESPLIGLKRFEYVAFGHGVDFSFASSTESLKTAIKSLLIGIKSQRLTSILLE